MSDDELNAKDYYENRVGKPWPYIKGPTKPTGWYERYNCGCLSDAMKYKKDLLGYCSHHGLPSAEVLPLF